MRQTPSLWPHRDKYRHRHCGKNRSIAWDRRQDKLYALKKETAAEKSARTEAVQAVLKTATEIPLECARACAKAVELSRCAAEKGSLGVISDAGAAVMAAYSGLKSAALNVYINTSSLKDRRFAEAKLSELEVILKDVDVNVEAVYQLVKGKL